MTTDKAVIKASTLAAVFADAQPYVGKPERPILHAVQLNICNGRGQAIATDSYGLAVFTFDAEGSMSALIDADDVKRITTLAKAEAKTGYGAEAREIVLERDDETLTVRTMSATITARLNCGQFPNWEQLVTVPKVGTACAMFNPQFVERIGKLRLGESARTAPVVTIHAVDNAKPWHYHAAANGITFRGMLMPAGRAGTADVFSSLEVVKPS